MDGTAEAVSFGRSLLGVVGEIMSPLGQEVPFLYLRTWFVGCIADIHLGALAECTGVKPSGDILPRRTEG